MPVGKSWRTSQSKPQARAAGPTIPRARQSPERPRPFPRTGPGPTRSSRAGWRHWPRRGRAASRRSRHLILAGCVQIEPDSARPDHATAEAAAAKEGGQVEEIAPESPAVRGGRQKPDVAGQCPQVAGVVGQPFQLEGDAAQHLGTERRLDSRPAPRRPGSTPWRGRPRCRPPPAPSGGSCACSVPPTSVRSTPRC